MKFHRLILILLSVFSWNAYSKESEPKSEKRNVWPFDQRQIALLQSENQEFPDDRTTAQIMDQFVKHGRVRWVTQRGGPGQLVPFSVPKDFQWQSSVSTRQLGLKYKADGLLKLSQKGTMVTLEWYATLDGRPLFFETVNLPQAGPRPGEDEARRKRLADWIADIWVKIPGQGYVVGRDMTTIKLEGAKQVGLKVGDLVELKRLETFERHPLLNTMIRINASITGRARILTMEDPFTVAKIEYESDIDPIQEGDRYLLAPNQDSSKAAVSAEVAPPGPGGPEGSKAEAKDDDGRKFISIFGIDRLGDSGPPATSQAEAARDAEPRYKILDIYGWGHLSSVRHTESVVGGTNPYEMGALAPGFSVQAKAYITRNILLMGDLGFSFFNFKGLETVYGTGVSNIGSGMTSYGFSAGFRNIFLEDAKFPGEVVVKAGYTATKLTLANVSTDVAPTGKNYGGYLFGVSVQMPVQGNFGAYFGGAKVLAATLEEVGPTGGDEYSNEVWSFEVGAKYFINKMSDIVAGLDFYSASTTYTGTATRATASLSTNVSSTTYQVAYLYRF